MRITEVALTDIKSYKERTVVPIEGGVTAILGENGAGKSTIQEAIGFALFNSLPFDNKDFVREGASSGTVEVTFEQDTADGTQRFRVTRSAGRSNYAVYRYDFEADEWIDQEIDSVSELLRWLCARFDVADRNELQSLWKSCIGVPQTRFLSDFAQTTANRTQTFDALLDLDAYEESWNVLKDVPDVIERQQRDLRGDINTLTGAVQDLPDERSKAESLSSQVNDLQSEIDRKTSELSTKRDEYDGLAETQGEIEQLQQDLDSLNQKIEATGRELETAKRELKDAEEAQQKCEENREEYEQYKQARERQEELEEREVERDELKEQKAAQDQEITKIEFEVEQLEEDLEELEEARETLESHEEEKERYEELEERIKSLRDREDEVEELEDNIERLIGEIEETEDEMESVGETITEINEEWEVTTHPDDLSEEINEREARRKLLTSERERLKEQLERLRDTEVDAPCPTCDQPLDKEHRSETIEQREKRIEEIKSEHADLARELGELRERRDAAASVKQRVDKLPVHRDKIESLESDLDGLRTEQKNIDTELSELENELEELPELKIERDDLEEAYNEYQTAEFRVADNSDVPEQLEQKQVKLDDEQTALEEIEDELEAFEGLDEELAGAEETLAETESGYNRYLQYEKQASQVEERQEMVERLEGEREKFEGELNETKEELEVLQESFDEERLETLDSEIDALRGEIERARGILDEKQENLEEARTKIDRLEAKLDDRQEKLQQLKGLRADEEFANWVRENVRQAGPKMREIITDRIGERANELFRSIRGASAETLEWTNNYEIVVHDADVRKSFSTLSGGEKMAAALAVRLAILEQLASVGIAFLDEPTANLDRQKKRNLVTQLKQLDSFDQLTVISHDETFDSMTDYTITVEKDQRISEVNVN